MAETQVAVCPFIVMLRVPRWPSDVSGRWRRTNLPGTIVLMGVNAPRRYFQRKTETMQSKSRLLEDRRQQHPGLSVNASPLCLISLGNHRGVELAGYM